MRPENYGKNPYIMSERRAEGHVNGRNTMEDIRKRYNRGQYWVITTEETKTAIDTTTKETTK